MIIFSILLKIDDEYSLKENPLMARSEWNHTRYPKYITGTDRRSVRAQTVLSLSQPLSQGMQWRTSFLLEF
jgi:hypothetical protein